jgi:hypothetical protein
MSAFCETAARDDVKSFFAEHKLPAAARALQQALERIDTCVGMKERQTAAFQSWLQER